MGYKGNMQFMFFLDKDFFYILYYCWYNFCCKSIIYRRINKKKNVF